MKYLKSGLVAVLLTLGLGAQAEMTTKEAADLLSPSVFSFATTRSGDAFCTATKIGPKEYLTALHCAMSLETHWRLESVEGEYAFIRSVTASVGEKSGRGKLREDWAVLNATAENEAPALPLGCSDPHYVGESVAYMGFPQGLVRAFGRGYVSTMKGTRNNADIFVDLPAAPGASGSAVISLDNGHIMGVLTEGVLNTRTTEFYMIGLESIEHLDQCEDWAERMKYWEEVTIGGDDEPVEVLNPEQPTKVIPDVGDAS